MRRSFKKIADFGGRGAVVESVSGSINGSGSSVMLVSDCVQNTVLDYKYEIRMIYVLLFTSRLYGLQIHLPKHIRENRVLLSPLRRQSRWAITAGATRGSCCEWVTPSKTVTPTRLSSLPLTAQRYQSMCTTNVSRC